MYVSTYSYISWVTQRESNCNFVAFNRSDFFYRTIRLFEIFRQYSTRLSITWIYLSSYLTIWSGRPWLFWPYHEPIAVAEIKADRHGEREKLILTLRNMAKTNAGVEALFKGKSIPELVALLDHPNPKGQGSPNSVFLSKIGMNCWQALWSRIICLDNSA